MFDERKKVVLLQSVKVEKLIMNSRFWWQSEWCTVRWRGVA